ncbi:protein kinase domain-containing protein [Embleya scabrispora]|nr:lipopolysaccharide kinase InaA family protein [Embleya scabrispora]
MGTEPAHVCGRGSDPGVVGGHVVVRRVRARKCVAVYEARAGVVLKVVCARASDSARDRLDNERAFLTLLAHSPIAPNLLGAGEAGDARYLAIAWRPGVTLERLARYAGPLGAVDSEANADLFAATATAVGAAFTHLHHHGVAHGDVSPANIVLAPDGSATLIDFESAHRLTTADSPRRRPAGAPAVVRRKTTRAYLPPELFPDDGREPYLTHPPTVASEQYALAAVLRRLLDGDSPRPGGAVLDEPAPSAGSLTRSRPATGWPARRWPALPGVLRTALDREPTRRFPTIRAFALALDDALT